jgi:hypothetical protein
VGQELLGCRLEHAEPQGLKPDVRVVEILNGWLNEQDLHDGTLEGLIKAVNCTFPSFPWKRESRKFRNLWTPASAGVTTTGLFTTTSFSPAQLLLSSFLQFLVYGRLKSFQVGIPQERSVHIDLRSPSHPGLGAILHILVDHL